MKKMIKPVKLTLSVNTVRVLEAKDLQLVTGGVLNLSLRCMTTGCH